MFLSAKDKAKAMPDTTIANTVTARTLDHSLPASINENMPTAIAAMPNITVITIAMAFIISSDLGDAERSLPWIEMSFIAFDKANIMPVVTAAMIIIAASAFINMPVGSSEKASPTTANSRIMTRNTTKISLKFLRIEGCPTCVPVSVLLILPIALAINIIARVEPATRVPSLIMALHETDISNFATTLTVISIPTTAHINFENSFTICGVTLPFIALGNARKATPNRATMPASAANIMTASTKYPKKFGIVLMVSANLTRMRISTAIDIIKGSKAFVKLAVALDIITANKPIAAIAPNMVTVAPKISAASYFFMSSIMESTIAT